MRPLGQRRRLVVPRNLEPFGQRPEVADVVFQHQNRLLAGGQIFVALDGLVDFVDLKVRINVENLKSLRNTSNNYRSLQIPEQKGPVAGLQFGLFVPPGGGRTDAWGARLGRRFTLRGALDRAGPQVDRWLAEVGLCEGKIVNKLRK